MVTPLSRSQPTLLSPRRNHSSSTAIDRKWTFFVVTSGKLSERSYRSRSPNRLTVPVPVRSSFGVPCSRMRRRRSSYWVSIGAPVTRSRVRRGADGTGQPSATNGLAATNAAAAAYDDLLEGLEKRFADVPNATLRRKQARQAARSVLPNATETRIVVTGNYRAWRHFVAMRASEHADVEIRELAIACLRELQRVAGNVFGDFRISSLADGTEVAASPYVTEG